MYIYRYATICPCISKEWDMYSRKSSVKLRTVHVPARMWVGMSDPHHESEPKHHLHLRQLAWRSIKDGQSNVMLIA